jgi:hypothetical protein
MRYLLTITMMCALFGVSHAQATDTVHNVGKDRDGDVWYLDTDMVVRPRPPADWVRVMPIYTNLAGRTLVFIFNVDCSDNTYQLVKAFSMDAQGRKTWERDENGRWSNFTGYSGNAARIVCRTNAGRFLDVRQGVISEGGR